MSEPDEPTAIGDRTIAAPAAHAPAPLFTSREQRIVLWVTVGAVCWRWLTAVRSPLPSVDACRDLWLARRLAAVDPHALADALAEPLWALLLAAARLLPVDAFEAAQVLACLFGGLVVWPVAVAAERLRQGAGLPAAILALAAAGPVVSAGTGSAAALLALAMACCALCLQAGHWKLAALCFAVVLGGVADGVLHGATLAAPWHPAAEMRLGWGIAGVLALLSVLPPRPRRIAALWAVAAVMLAMSLAFAAGTRTLAAASAVVAVLAGVGLARLSVRLRDVLLCGAVLLEFYTAWQAVEPRSAVAERALGHHLARRLDAEQHVVGDLPRVLYFAGEAPVAIHGTDALVQQASRADVACVVLGPDASRQATLTATLAGRFVRLDLPHDLADMLAEQHVVVFGRR
ncbi:MAG TPA: hypothetical protein VFZ65_19485 [Planctomycetota bacterium]|nr:hypothetical protein [Planctomycetota bacterium]